MRIYTSESNPEDFCYRCFPMTEQEAYDKYGKLGDGPDGRGNCFAYNADAPWFYDDDEHGYECSCCGVKLEEHNSQWTERFENKLKYGTKETFEFVEIDGEPYCKYSEVN